MTDLTNPTSDEIDADLDPLRERRQGRKGQRIPLVEFGYLLPDGALE